VEIKHYIIIILIVLVSTPVAYSQVELWQAYEKKTLYAQTNYDAGTPYEWIINGDTHIPGTTSTTFLAHFDRTTISEEAQTPIVLSESYETTMFSQGFKGKAEYQRENNLPLDEGTIEMWIEITLPLDSDEFNNSKTGGYSYILRHYNPELSQSFYVSIIHSKTLGFIGYINYTTGNDWSRAAQVNAAYHQVLPNEPVHIAVTYSLENNRSIFYLNGFKVAQRRYDLHFIPVDTFIIGNEHVIIDELRIQNKVLRPEEIRDNYLRATPYGKNDIQQLVDLPLGTAVELSIEGETADTVILSTPFTVSPDEYTPSYRKTLTITPSISGCRYSDKPRPFEQLQPIDHHIEIHNPTQHIYNPIYILCEPQSYPLYRRYRVRAPDHNKFPKTHLHFWSSPMSEDEVEDISMFDLVSLSGSNVMKPLYVARLRENNPNITVLYYTDVQGPKPEYGANNYYDYDFPLIDDWRLRDSQGEYVHNTYFPMPMYNIWVGNTGYHETYADWMRDMYFELGIFDGIWIDNYNSGIWWLVDGEGGYTAVDVNKDGIDEDLSNPDDRAFFQNTWDEGLVLLGSLLRERIGQDSILIGNNANKEHAAQILNGKFWEGSFELSNFDSLINPTNQGSFAYWQANAQTPKKNTNCHYQHTGVGEKWRRYGLAMSLFFDLYHYATIDNGHYNEIHWLDEYIVNFETGIPTQSLEDRWYLGEPTNEYYEVQPGVYRRDFQKGIVLLNNNDVQANVELGGTYRYILGSIDPVANPGGETTEVRLQSKDGRILLKTTSIQYTVNYFNQLFSHYGTHYPDIDGDGFLSLRDLVLFGSYMQ